MIKLKINFPSLVKGPSFRNFWSRSFRAFGTRCIEIQLFQYGIQLLDIDLDLEFTGSDHAGPRLELGVLGYYVSIGFPESRHWNPITDDWE